MRLNYLTSSAVAELKTTAKDELWRYSSSKSFLEPFFKGTANYLVPSRVEVAALPTLKVGKNPEANDEENAVVLHTALRKLTPSQAADERLWAWLAHGPYWDYMRKRWPADEFKSKTLSTDEAKKGFRYVLEHYFAVDSRALVRNGVARLWWFGKATYDEKATHPYRRTALMLRTADSRQSIMERQYWRNPDVLSPLLDRVEYWEKKNFSFYQPRERFRLLCKQVNAWGGTMLLDTLSSKDISAMVDAVAKQEMSNSTQP
ncbi:MAG TPA: DUF6339 family protein [Gemmatimonadaceae bacterium]|nr:DUF6339 family protein [Gemmatimonadaceae bacterium]